MRKLASLLLLLLLLIPAFAQADNASGNWYEIFVPAFRDSNGDGVGDLNGVREKLDYLEDMGYTGLWLTPIMPSPSYHKYDVTDYLDVDPSFGTLDDLKALAADCHARGIRLIIDLPVNHSSSQHPWFLAACEALRTGSESPYINYYNFSDKQLSKYIPVQGTALFYEEQFSGGGMPDLNLSSEALRGELRAILSFWLADCGIDGFRLDATTSYFTGHTDENIAFLAWLKQECEAIRPGSFLVGECWTGLETIADYYTSGVDAFFLFPMSQAEGWVARSLRARKPALEYQAKLEETLSRIPGLLAPFLSNHDTGRTIGAIQGRSSLPKAKFAEGLLQIAGGAAFTYYGEEIGMVGSGDDPNKRLPMYWADDEMCGLMPGTTSVEYAYPSVQAQLGDPASLLNYCRQLNQLRLRFPAVADGATAFLFADANLLLMQRTTPDSTVLIAVNFSPKAAGAITLPAGGWTIGADIETGTEAASLADGALSLPPYAIVILAE